MKAGLLERVAGGDVEVLHAVEHEVHPGDGGGDVDELLAVEAERARVAAATLHLGERRDEHAAGAEGRVVDALAGLRLEHLRHQVDERAVGVELLRRVAAVVGELLDEVLVAVAELVLGDGREAQRVLREVLDQVLERLVGQLRLVGPGRVAEDAGQALGVGRLDGAEGVRAAPGPRRARRCGRRSSARRRGSRSGRWRSRARSASSPVSSRAAWYSSSHTSERRLKKSSGKMYCL